MASPYSCQVFNYQGFSGLAHTAVPDGQMVVIRNVTVFWNGAGLNPVINLSTPDHSTFYFWAPGGSQPIIDHWEGRVAAAESGGFEWRVSGAVVDLSIAGYLLNGRTALVTGP
jgi:hypothetical protein